MSRACTELIGEDGGENCRMRKEIAIITGATGGLGREFTRQLIEEMDEIWAIGRKRDKLTELTQEFGSKIKSFSIDLSKVSNLDEIQDCLSHEDYYVKYLINNAGSGRMASSVSFSAQEIESHISTHDTAMAVLCNICIPYMAQGSHIINVASQSAFQPVAYINLYAASKAFCYSYSRALNMELKDKGIVVTVACPGWIKTELLQTQMNGHPVQFPHLAKPEDVVRKAIKDAKKGKDMSVYSAYVKRMQFYSKVYPHRWIMNLWMKSIRKYIEQDEEV